MAKILILANNDIGLFKFRKEIIEALLGHGHEVYISLPDGDLIPKFQALGCNYIETPISRRGTNPITDFKLLLKYRAIIKNLMPDVALTYTIKPNVYGGLACKAGRIPYITNITGLGSAVGNGGLIQKITLFLYKNSLKRAACVFFQNQTNRQYFLDKKILTGNNRLIPGSGVNLTYHCLEDYPGDENLKFLFIGRVMKEKGIDEYLHAAEIIKGKYPSTEFHIVGFCEEEYETKLSQLQTRGIIAFHGLQNDVHSFIKICHAIILPTYHEGMSNVLLEAASSGRPVLASDIPGCRETFDEGVSGYGFAAKNTEDLINTLEKFIRLPYKDKKQMGLAARAKMEREFDRQLVIDSYVEEINKILF